MNSRTVSILLLGLALAACDRESQELPFSSSAGETVSKQLSAEGGLLSTPAGATVEFPAGAVSGETVRLTRESAPSAAKPSGTSLSDGFKLEPAGMRLASAAGVAVRFDPAAAGSRAWLASVVNVTPQGVVELGNTRVDLSTGRAEAKIGTLGTLAVVLPDPAAVFELRRGGKALASQAAAPRFYAAGDGVTDSVTVQCGDAGNRCTGVSVEASDNLTSRVENAAAIYPAISGALRVGGGVVTGKVTLTTAFRAQLKSGQTAENVSIDALIEATPGSRAAEGAGVTTFSQMRHSIHGASDGSGSLDAGRTQEEVATLTIPRSGSAGTVTITRSFQLRNDGGQLENAWVTVRFPVHVHQ